MSDLTPRIFNIQKYSLHDGPGIRTLVFFKGCPLRCLWCANPEGQNADVCLMRRPNLCANCGACIKSCPTGALSDKDGKKIYNASLCSHCHACESACLQDALSLCGKTMSIDEIMQVVLEDKTFYEVSGGGLTLGGGEPLAQPDAAAALLQAARAAGIHRAVETCGFASLTTIKKIAPLVDLFLFDIKMMDSALHKKLTGQGNELILDNFKYLVEQGHNLRCRMPIVPDLNANDQEMQARAEFLKNFTARPNFAGVDLLPYHRLGVGKYASLGMDYQLEQKEAASDPAIQRYQQILADAGINAKVVRH